MSLWHLLSVRKPSALWLVLLDSYRNSKQRREKIEGANLFIFVTLQSCSWRCLVVFSREGRNLQDWSRCYRAIPATSSWWTGWRQEKCVALMSTGSAFHYSKVIFKTACCCTKWGLRDTCRLDSVSWLILSSIKKKVWIYTQRCYLSTFLKRWTFAI